ncbi:transcriptional regulatory protein CusR [mine drainage metagenome]|uniref:Transcriptional regulatory protein CusR n=1 Tax=mine drainage metagenome TaxID=410659 RepID=A0A1J5TCU9_9ZZZZ
MASMQDMARTAWRRDSGGTASAELLPVLLIDDDIDLALTLKDGLADQGLELIHVENAEDGLHQAHSGQYRLIILERRLGGGDGIDLVKTLRADHVEVPILFLSGLGSVEDRVKGLLAGADDYLPKPFAFVELAARLHVLLRRPLLARETVLRVGDLEMDLIERTVRRDGRPISLLPREIKLLDYLMRHPGRVLSRTELLENVWNYRTEAESNLVDVHVGKLRRKIDLPNLPPLLHTVRGSGFMLKATGH